MFNPITASELVETVGNAVDESARWTRPLDPFQVAQLKSARSIAGFLATELAGYPPALQTFRARVSQAADRTGGVDALRGLSRLTGFRHDIDAASDASALGETVSALLEWCRANPAATQLADDVRASLAELVQTEIEILTAGAEGQRRRETVRDCTTK